MPHPPHPRSCFFEQTVLQGEVGHDLPEGCGLTNTVNSLYEELFFHFGKEAAILRQLQKLLPLRSVR